MNPHDNEAPEVIQADRLAISDEDLAAMAEQAKRDDWHLRFVGSDIRQLIGQLQRARAAFASPAESAPGAGGDIGAGNHDCLAKRRPGEPMFILLGRDPDAHNIVRSWASRRKAAGGDPEHCEQVFDIADAMQVYAAMPENAPASAPSPESYPPVTVFPSLPAGREAIAREVRKQLMEDRDGAEYDVLRIGCAEMLYCDPDDAADKFALNIADAILTLGPSVAWSGS